MTLATPFRVSSQRATVRAFSQCAFIRSARVFSPRLARKASNGPMIPPTEFCRNLRSEEHTSELQSQSNLVCRLLLEKKNKNIRNLNNSTQCSNFFLPRSHRTNG